MQQENDELNMDILQDMLFSRLKNIYLEEDEPYFMINYKPHPHGKCFLATDDINKHTQNGCLIFPKSFCKKLRNLAEPIQRDRQQIKMIVEKYIEKLIADMVQLATNFGDQIKFKFFPNPEPVDFLKNFYKGNFKDDTKLLQALEEIIRKWNVYENNHTLNSIKGGLLQAENVFKRVVNKMTLKLEKIISLLDDKGSSGNEGTIEEIEKPPPKISKIYTLPKSFEQVDLVEINKNKCIPWTNGIDIHPFKNVYVAMGCENGDLVIRDQDSNKEINRIKLRNNSGGATQSCLWSPSGNKIMVSTRENHSIYIYDETGENLLKSIEKNYFKDGQGAIWLSEKEVAVGYSDGVVKFFNIDKGKEIGSVKLSGIYAWGMDCLDDSHLLVGDYSGSISKIDWKNGKIKLIKADWHSNHITCIKLNQDKTKLLTCSDDYLVKLMELKDQLKLWEYDLNSYATGISWVPGNLYVLTLSFSNRLVALNAKNGTKIAEFNKLSNNPASFRINFQTAEVFVGDTNGKIQRLKICEE